MFIFNSSPDDPYTYSEKHELRRHESFQKLQEEKRRRLAEKKAASQVTEVTQRSDTSEKTQTASEGSTVQREVSQQAKVTQRSATSERTPTATQGLSMLRELPEESKENEPLEGQAQMIVDDDSEVIVQRKRKTPTIQEDETEADTQDVIEDRVLSSVLGLVSTLHEDFTHVKAKKRDRRPSKKIEQMLSQSSSSSSQPGSSKEIRSVVMSEGDSDEIIPPTDDEKKTKMRKSTTFREPLTDEPNAAEGPSGGQDDPYYFPIDQSQKDREYLQKLQEKSRKRQAALKKQQNQVWHSVVNNYILFLTVFIVPHSSTGLKTRDN